MWMGGIRTIQNSIYNCILGAPKPVGLSGLGRVEQKNGSLLSSKLPLATRRDREV